MGTVEVLTFGCRLNAFESEAMRGLAERAGGHDGAVLVNTCAVTAEAEKQARKAIRAAHRRNPAAPIVVTGCAAQIAPAAWASLPGGDLLIEWREEDGHVLMTGPVATAFTGEVDLDALPAARAAPAAAA